MTTAAETSRRLMDWYDDQARVLPWRTPPTAPAGTRPDPYRVWLSEIMLQQTTVAAVTGYFQRFVTLWPDVAALAAAPQDRVMAEWAGLGYYARARNLLACARMVVAEHGGRFPADEATLVRLPGIGPYTAAAIAAIAFDRRAVVMDGNVERVVARYFAVRTPLPAAKRELHALADRLTPQERAGDHAQAMMDLGATICTPRSPACHRCPVAAGCAALALGIAAGLPARAPRAPRPLRRGIAYVGRTPGGAWLVEQRPARGLLGGMLCWPCTAFSAGRAPEPAPPAAAPWHTTGAEVRHVFTHFELILQVEVALLAGPPDRGHLIAADAFDPAAMPSLMRKVHALARDAFDGD